jgi:GT2 family glycosyltransferase
MRARTNVVIITFNALAYTKATLDSLFDNTKTPYNLTIIDNASDDGSPEYLSSLILPSECKKYTLIKNSENTGVGHAYNQGQQVSFKDGMEYTAFCNNDLYFSNNWLGKLECRLDQNPNIAMLSPLRPSAKVSYDGIISTRDRLAQIPETSSWTTELQEYTNLPVE